MYIVRRAHEHNKHAYILSLALSLSLSLSLCLSTIGAAVRIPYAQQIKKKKTIKCLFARMPRWLINK